MGPPHFNKWVCHLLHYSTSKLSELTPIAILAALYLYQSLSLQNLVNVGLLRILRFAFGEFWQVGYRKLLKPPEIKPLVPWCKLEVSFSGMFYDREPLEFQTVF